MKFTIVIEFDPATGKLSVSGIPENLTIALGILEVAKINIIQYATKKMDGKSIVNPFTGEIT